MTHEAARETLIPGLVSITFRHLLPEEIVNLCVINGLRSVEWGGDIHVPRGALPRAREAARLCRENGLDIAAYGSYYRFEDILHLPGPLKDTPPSAPSAALSPPAPPRFADVLESAAALGAPRIRVWAGVTGSEETSPERRSRIVQAARNHADSAGRRGIELCFEYHGGTLTDTPDSTRGLLADIDHPNVFTFWQPRHHLSTEENAAALKALLPWVKNVHVFHWGPGGYTDRRALEGCREAIRSYCRILADGGGTHPVLLEFVKNDDPASLHDDSAALLGIIREITPVPGGGASSVH